MAILAEREPSKVGEALFVKVMRRQSGSALVGSVRASVAALIGLGGALIGFGLATLSPKPLRLCGEAAVVVFSGGSAEHPFSAVIRQGALDAAQELGCQIDLVDSDWKPGRMASQLKTVIADRPTSVCMMGHPGEDILAPLAEEARRKGVHLSTLNVDVPTLRDNFSEFGMGYVGADQRRAGETLARACIRRFHLGPEDEAVVFAWGAADPQIQTPRRMRARGCIEVLNAAGMKVHVVDIPTPFEEGDRDDKEAVRGFLASSMARYPDASLVVADNSWIPAEMASIPLPPGVRMAAFDLTPANVSAMKAGRLDLVQDQQPYLQGYLCVLQAAMSVQFGFSGLEIETGAGVIDKESVAELDPLIERRIR